MSKHIQVGILLYILLLWGCGTQDSKLLSAEQIEKELSGLAPAQGRVRMMIGGKRFYDEASVFKNYIIATDTTLRTSLTDQFASNTIVDLYSATPIKSYPHILRIVKGNIPIGSADYGEVLVGKLNKEDNKLGEGYMLSEGTITIQERSPERLIILLEGQLVKPGSAHIRENFVPVNGYIIINKPVYE